MEPIQRGPEPDPPSRQPSHTSRCSYCGSPLNSFYYFCVACGTPYRQWHEAVSAPLPPVLDDEKRIQRMAPHVPTLFFSYLLAIIGSHILAMLLFQENREDLVILLGTGVIFILTCVYSVLFWPTLAAQLKRIGLFHPAALAGYAMLPAVLGVNYLLHHVLIPPEVSEAPELIGGLRDSLGRVTLIVLFCVFPAVTEELAFRGLLQHWLATAIRPRRALVLASALFAAMHLSVVSFGYLFLAGLLLGWVKQQTNSLYPSMLIHFLHNLAVIELFYLLT